MSKQASPNPHDDGGAFPGFTAAIGQQRRAANRVKREQPITVVIGNPPYKDKAKGLGGWVEGDGRPKGSYAPLDDWQPPRDWGLGIHARHLRNLYVYFWRWAARKVFEDIPGQAPGGGSGIVAYITAASFLNGAGFARMRQSLRQRCHEIWVIDCSPEGHQPEVSDRIFQGVQQPVHRARIEGSVGLPGVRQAGAGAVVQLSTQDPRTPTDWGPPPTLIAGRHSA